MLRCKQLATDWILNQNLKLKTQQIDKISIGVSTSLPFASRQFYAIDSAVHNHCRIVIENQQIKICTCTRKQASIGFYIWYEQAQQNPLYIGIYRSSSIHYDFND